MSHERSIGSCRMIKSTKCGNCREKGGKTSYAVHNRPLGPARHSGRGFCRKELPVQFPEGRRQSDGRFLLPGAVLNHILKNKE